ncbi:unnamed protein product [Linum trigynum]|uniref:Gnk2-homologous domain-containing protein n=2 Tax=Linum trigynum TaxID=586398 RepID=A0AAV2FSW9_9ROSI
MEQYPSSSSTMIITGALLLAVITCLGGAWTGNAQITAGSTEFPSPVCDGAGDALGSNWAYYVEQVLTALETTAPNSQAYYAQFWYPEYATGNPRGAAACSTTLGVAECEACLAGVKKNLETCKSRQR